MNKPPAPGAIDKTPSDTIDHDAMKILHVADYLPDLHTIAGGAEHATRRIIEEQARAGIEVEVATLPADVTCGSVPWQRHHELRNVDRYAPRLAYAVKQLFLPADPLAGSDLARVIARSRPDVVHYHNLHFMGLTVVAQARAAGVPSVWSIYDYWLFCPSFMLLTNHNVLCTRGHSHRCVDCVGTRRVRALKPVKRMLFHLRKPIFERPAAAVDRFVVLSESSKDILTQQGIDGARIRVVPQYVWREAMASTEEIAPVPGRLLYVGWVEQRKGLDVVVRAMARIASRWPQLHLEVLGLPADPEYQTLVEGLARDGGIGDRVHFRGKVGRDELLAELRRAFLVTIPEQWENMSPVILTEAMAAGACVLASRVGGIRYFVEDNRSGLLAIRDDADDWADRLDRAMANPNDVRSMGRAARERAQQVFDPQQITANLLDLYRSLSQHR